MMQHRAYNRSIGTALIAALVAAALLMPQDRASASMLITDVPEGGGIALAHWGGGAVESMPVVARWHGCDLTSAWRTAGGELPPARLRSARSREPGVRRRR